MVKPSDDPGGLEAMFEAARVLERSGRIEDAKTAYLTLLQYDPSHFGALNNLGSLLSQSGFRSAATTAYAEAVKHHPDQAMARINLANLLAEGAPAEARTQYQAALAIEPDNVDAHRGLANVLIELGETAAGAHHRRIAWTSRPIIALPYRGAGPGIPLLLLVAAAGDNVPTRWLIDDRVFRVTAVAPDYLPPEWLRPGAPPPHELPPHELIVNAIGDPALSSAALVAASRLVEASGAPVINHPDAVLQTGRAEMAARLAAIPGVRAPLVVTCRKDALIGADAPRRLADHGLRPPLLLRSPGFHTGRHFVRIEREDEIRAAAAQLPGDEILAIEALDARGGDGLARKYRVIFVEGRPYPLHLAISADWKVHYFTAGMTDHPERRAEEAAFLADFRTALGAETSAALDAIGALLSLDYGGIDFGLGRDGALLPFEANATMLVAPPEPGTLWDYRRPAVAAIREAVHDMLLRRRRVAISCAPASPH